MKVFTLFFLFLGLAFGGQAQSLMCGDHMVKKVMEKNNPGYLEVVNKTFEQAKAKAMDYTSRDRQEVYSIDVVVHIVYQNEEQNLDDSIVINQILTLNEDFRRRNADTLLTREIFKEVVGDPGIEFRLVDIRRVETETRFLPTLTGLPDNVKVTSQGGSDAEDPSGTLNIWVCRLEPLTIFGIPLGQVLGYAYPPADLANWPAGSSAPSLELEGVVVDYRVFGRNNPLTIDPGTGNQVSGYGRTTTHEVGHYLGLRHIWGDVLFGDGCSEDDGVEDTPNQASASNWNCDYSVNSCADEDLPDMIENYMDYADETCMNSFTLGQIGIMRAVLEGPRKGLIESETTSLVQHFNTWPISLYPNPIRGSEFFLDCPSEFADLLRIELYSAEGRLLSLHPAVALGQSISTGELSPGLYIIHIRNSSEGDLLAVKKLIKQ
jgi:hypothetical protein